MFFLCEENLKLTNMLLYLRLVWYFHLSPSSRSPFPSLLIPLSLLHPLSPFMKRHENRSGKNNCRPKNIFTLKLKTITITRRDFYQQDAFFVLFIHTICLLAGVCFPERSQTEQRSTIVVGGTHAVAGRNQIRNVLFLKNVWTDLFAFHCGGKKNNIIITTRPTQNRTVIIRVRKIVRNAQMTNRTRSMK